MAVSQEVAYILFALQKDYYYIVLREDYVHLFQISTDKKFARNKKTDEDRKEYTRQRNHAVVKAYIIAVLEQLSDKQIAKGVKEKDVRVFLSFSQLEARIHGGCKLRVLKYAMQELLDDGYVVKYANSNPHIRTLCYRINASKMRHELSTLPKRDNKGSYHAVSPHRATNDEDALTHDEDTLTHDEDTLTHDEDALTHDEDALMHDEDALMHDEDALMHDEDALMHTRITKKNRRRTKEERERNTDESDLIGDGVTASSPTHALLLPAERSEPDIHSQQPGSQLNADRIQVPEVQTPPAATRDSPLPPVATAPGTLVPPAGNTFEQRQTHIRSSAGTSSSPGKTAQTQRSPRQKATQPARTPESLLSEEARAVYTAWCSLFIAGVPLTPAIVRAAQGLAKPVANWSQELHISPAELLRRIMDRLYEMDKTGYYKRGVNLYDIEREFEGWQSAMEREMRKPSAQKHIPTLEEDPYSIAALLAEQNAGHCFA